MKSVILSISGTYLISDLSLKELQILVRLSSSVPYVCVDLQEVCVCLASPHLKLAIERLCQIVEPPLHFSLLPSS